MAQKITNKFETIANNYGEVIFRCALQHTFDTGAQNFTTRRVNATKRSIKQHEAEALEAGKIPIMTAEFQIAILECATEIAQVNDFWELMRFVKKNLFIGR